MREGTNLSSSDSNQGPLTRPLDMKIKFNVLLTARTT